MSRTDIVDEKKAQQAMELLRKINGKAAIITTPIEKLDGKKILEVMEKPVSLADEMMDCLLYTSRCVQETGLRVWHVRLTETEIQIFIIL